jgi:hypothetical protein
VVVVGSVVGGGTVVDGTVVVGSVPSVVCGTCEPLVVVVAPAEVVGVEPAGNVLGTDEVVDTETVAVCPLEGSRNGAKRPRTSTRITVAAAAPPVRRVAIRRLRRRAARRYT